MEPNIKIQKVNNTVQKLIIVDKGAIYLDIYFLENLKKKHNLGLGFIKLIKDFSVDLNSLELHL